MKTLLVVLLGVLGVSAQLPSLPEAVGCGPRQAWVRGENPQVGAMTLTLEDPAEVGAITVTVTPDRQFMPYPSLLLFVDGENVGASLVKQSERGRYVANFRALNLDLAFGTHYVEVYAINEIFQPRMRNGYGALVNITIESEDIEIRSGKLPILYPLRLGTVQVAPARVAGFIQTTDGTDMPRGSEVEIGRIRIDAESLVSEQAEFTAISGHSNVRKMPPITLVDENGSEVGRSVTGANGFEIRFTNIVVFQGSKTFRIMMDTRRAPDNLMLSFEKLKYVIDGMPLSTSECNAPGTLTLKFSD